MTSAPATSSEPRLSADALRHTPAGNAARGAAGGPVRWLAALRPAGRADLLAAFGLCAIVLVTHGSALNDGLFFDDHWHRTTLRSGGWSLRDLIESATFDLPGQPPRLINLWWQEQPLQWRYARPVAMLVMKLELLLSRGSPAGVHACALFWHALASLLVYLLARWALQHRGWAFLAAATFAFQPHSVFGVSWIAARNALVSGVLFLAAAGAYVGASPLRAARGAGLSIPQLLAALLLWGLALFSRETAIIFPLLAPLLDLAGGGRTLLRRRLGVYGVMGVLAAVYLYWRLLVFPLADPPGIYFRPPAGALYPAWAAGKLAHMLFALVFQTPLFVGLATQGGATVRHALLYALMGLALAGIGVWYALTSRAVRARWVWPAWVVLAFVPVIPVFVMPHFAYLPAAALSIMLAAMVRGLRRWWRAGVLALLVIGSLWSFGVYRCLWRGIVRSEQLIYADILAHTPPPPSGSKLFFINLPAAGIYATVGLREAWGMADLEGYVLTFASHPLVMQKRCIVEPLSDNELVVSTAAPGYFSGLAGQMLYDGMRPGSPLTTGTFVPGPVFDTTVLAATEEGVTRLKFTFHRPLASPEYYFFVSSSERPACRLRFGHAVADVGVAATETLPPAAGGETGGAGLPELVRVIRPLAVQLASPIQTLLDDPQDLDQRGLEQLKMWWHSAGASRLQAESDAWRRANASVLAERERFFLIDSVARRIVQSDLFLTRGPGR